MKNYFYGLYFKSQSKEHTVAIIPARHKSGDVESSSIQIITESQSNTVPYGAEDFHKDSRGIGLYIGNNHFSKKGLKLNIARPDIRAYGTLVFDALTPLKYDIMGPFKYVPFMECRHSVISLLHTVRGELSINGTKYRFSDATGYIEGDRGRSFPKRYVWCHCNFGDISLMLSIADIPFFKGSFTGVICAILYDGQEYRLATYLGATAEKVMGGEATIRQGSMTLYVKLYDTDTKRLWAPKNGAMTRQIREGIASRARFKFTDGDSTLFDFVSDKASFEYEYLT